MYSAPPGDLQKYGVEVYKSRILWFWCLRLIMVHVFCFLILSFEKFPIKHVWLGTYQKPVTLGANLFIFMKWTLCELYPPPLSTLQCVLAGPKLNVYRWVVGSLFFFSPLLAENEKYKPFWHVLVNWVDNCDVRTLQENCTLNGRFQK